MLPLRIKKRSMLGFTLMELLSSTAVLGVVASIAMPFALDYSLQTRIEEGVVLLGELRQQVELGFSETGTLGTEIPSSPVPSGQIYGGPYYSYETLFGDQHDMWDRIEYQPKGHA